MSKRLLESEVARKKMILELVLPDTKRALLVCEWWKIIKGKSPMFVFDRCGASGFKLHPTIPFEIRGVGNVGLQTVPLELCAFDIAVAEFVTEVGRVLVAAVLYVVEDFARAFPVVFWESVTEVAWNGRRAIGSLAEVGERAASQSQRIEPMPSSDIS